MKVLLPLGQTTPLGAFRLFTAILDVSKFWTFIVSFNVNNYFVGLL